MICKGLVRFGKDLIRFCDDLEMLEILKFGKA